MDSFFMDQHFLRSPLRLYSTDPLDNENNNATNSLFSAAMMEKARAQLQLWGRAGTASGYSPADLHAMLLSSGAVAQNQHLYNMAAAAAVAAANSQHHGPPRGQMPPNGPPGGPPPHLWNHQGHPEQQWPPSMHNGLPPGLLGPPPAPAPPPTSTPSSSGSPSPNGQADLRMPKAMFPNSIHRYSPYSLAQAQSRQLSPGGGSSPRPR